MCATPTSTEVIQELVALALGTLITGFQQLIHILIAGGEIVLVCML